MLTAELTAINQYFLHAKMLGNWGFKALAGKVRAESIDEMKHADALIERILYLEDDAIPRLNDGIETCRLSGDNGTRLLLEEILKAEEEHRDWLKTQLDAMDRIGEPNDLAQKL